MKKVLALILAFTMVFALTACGSEEPTQAASEAQTTEAPATEAPTTAAPTTEAPTTEAPTTEAPTTEAPTTEAATQSGAVDTDKAAFYADFKNNVGKFTFVGEDICISQSSDKGGAMQMITAHNMVKITVPKDETDYFSAMYVDNGKMYVQMFLPAEDGQESKEEWYVSDIPAGEDPMGEYGDGSTEDLTYEDDMTMEYLETVEVGGVTYDKVKVTTAQEDEGTNTGIFWFEESKVEVWKVEMDQKDQESGATVHAVMEFFTNDEGIPSPSETPKEIGYEEATMKYAFAMMGLLFGEMEIGD